MYARTRGRKRWIGGLFRAARFAGRFISRRPRLFPIFRRQQRGSSKRRRLRR